MKRLFPDAPEEFSGLSDEELGDLLASFKSVSSALKAGEIDLAAHFGEEGDHTEEVMRQWREAAEYVAQVRAALAERSQGEANFAEEAKSLDAAFGDEAEAEVEVVAESEELAAEADGDDEDDDDDEEDEKAEELSAEAEAIEPEAVVAAATAEKPKPIRYPAVAKSHRGVEQAAGAVATLVASANGDGIRVGDDIDAVGYGQLVQDTMRRRGPVVKTKDGGQERIPLARVNYPFPEEFTLTSDPERNAEKIRALGSPYFGRDEMEHLLAAGGICAPPTPFYDLPQLSTTDRPVRDGLPSFRSERGGVLVPSVSTLADAAGAITVIEAADDEAGGTSATKSCLVVDCATWSETSIGAISHCRRVGNFNDRTWPEGIAHENGNTMAAHARTAEGRLLDRIDAMSLELARAAVYGASSSLLYALQISRVGIISRLRMDTRARFRVILPFWAAEMFSLDIVNGATGGGGERFDTPPEQVGALLSRFGFNVIWHKDEGIGGSATTEVWPNEVDGTDQEDWPGLTVIARLFPEGHFVHLDGGSLELGLVRDSDLNHTNDHELFGEDFENVFAVGPTQAAHRLAISVCPSGTLAATTTAITCSAT